MISVHRYICSKTCWSIRGLKLINWLLYTIIWRSLFYWLTLQSLSRNTFSSKLFRLLNWNWMWMSNLCEARMLPTLPMGVLGLPQCCCTGTRWVPTDEGMSQNSWFSYCSSIFICLQLKLNLTKTRESQSEPGFFSDCTSGHSFHFSGWFVTLKSNVISFAFPS